MSARGILIFFLSGYAIDLVPDGCTRPVSRQISRFLKIRHRISLFAKSDDNPGTRAFNVLFLIENELSLEKWGFRIL